MDGRTRADVQACRPARQGGLAEASRPRRVRVGRRHPGQGRVPCMARRQGARLACGRKDRAQLARRATQPSCSGNADPLGRQTCQAP